MLAVGCVTALDRETVSGRVCAITEDISMDLGQLRCHPIPVNKRRYHCEQPDSQWSRADLALLPPERA